MRGEAVAQPPLARTVPDMTETSFREGAGAAPKVAKRRLRVTSPDIAPPGSGSAPSSDPSAHGIPLRRLLVGFDLTCMVLAWVLALWLPSSILGPRATASTDFALQLAVGVATGLAAMALQRLYLARVCSIRSVELAHTGRAALVSGIAVLLVSEGADLPISIRRAAFGAALVFFLVSMLRGIYSSMLRERRARGLHARPIVLVGTNDEARELATLVDTHPEFGYRIVGVIGCPDEHEAWAGTPAPEVDYLGPLAGSVEAIARSGANGVIVAASAIDSDKFNRLTREYLRADLHVHLSSGLRGIDARRLRSVPLAHEPLFYLERVSLSRANLLVKRAMDLTIATTMLVLASPVLLVAALAVKLNDRGPIIFRQQRVGKHGKTFDVLKFRTMVPNAEQLLPAIAKANGNLRDSILFKLEDDPRLTKVGRILEAASIDELPQLINVIKGEMSMVGPRPALPKEVAQFDDELLDRLSVPPGITGLWQVEARDNPSFSAYKRLDLFYVENWSVTMDLAVIVETASSVLSRLARGRSHR